MSKRKRIPNLCLYIDVSNASFLTFPEKATGSRKRQLEKDWEEAYADQDGYETKIVMGTGGSTELISVSAQRGMSPTTVVEILEKVIKLIRECPEMLNEKQGYEVHYKDGAIAEDPLRVHYDDYGVPQIPDFEL